MSAHIEIAAATQSASHAMSWQKMSMALTAPQQKGSSHPGTPWGTKQLSFPGAQAVRKELIYYHVNRLDPLAFIH